MKSNCPRFVFCIAQPSLRDQSVTTPFLTFALPPIYLFVVLVLLDIKGVEVEEPKPERLLEPPEAMWYCQVECADARTGVVERRERREHVLKRGKSLLTARRVSHEDQG